jgi:predicted nucleic acid-binding protein
LAELAVGPLVTVDGNERVRRQHELERAEALFDVLPFDVAAARSFARVSASLRRAGRKVSARAYDALIAATAIANDLPLYTCNPRDFDGIAGLDVRPVPLPDA